MAADSTTHPPHSPDPTSEARTAFLASLKSVGSNLDADLRSQTRSRAEKDDEAACKQGNELEKLADQGRQGLKEVGDLQNWAELLERDLLIVEETLRLADEEDMKNGKMPAQQDGPQPSRLRRWF
ncbi:hypothetical protein CIHG_03741 [Coccidioides immitis H538.4]|uniref:Biogenesis of lysosome-related organelles complex 1 subunit 1 n=1 Tax=Coccidioides immitis H538.4 TaxID=396776 RepID=A0A0J8RM65_COCIT|nr:hypothetical protein CIHG_03741 [Coccidioides immitis H538.4]